MERQGWTEPGQRATTSPRHRQPLRKAPAPAGSKKKDPTGRSQKALTPWLRGKDEGLSEHRPPLAALASGRCRSAGRRLGVRHPATNVATARAGTAAVSE